AYPPDPSKDTSLSFVPRSKRGSGSFIASLKAYFGAGLFRPRPRSQDPTPFRAGRSRQTAVRAATTAAHGPLSVDRLPLTSDRVRKRTDRVDRMEARRLFKEDRGAVR